MGPDLLDEPLPRLLLGGPGSLGHGGPEISDLRLDLGARQHIEPAHQNGGFQDRGLGAVEAFERRMGNGPHDPAMKAWPRPVMP